MAKPVSTTDLEKSALKLVALDRQLAAAVSAALKAYARTKKATGRTYRALVYANALDAAMAETTVERPARRSRKAAQS